MYILLYNLLYTYCNIHIVMCILNIFEKKKLEEIKQGEIKKICGFFINKELSFNFY